MGPFVWNSNQNSPQLPPYSLYIKSGFSTTNYDSFGFDMRLWAKELLDYFHVPTWDASCQGTFAPCAWVGIPSCGTTPLDIYNVGGGGVQIRTENCTWFFSDGCQLYLPGGITFPDGTVLNSVNDLVETTTYSAVESAYQITSTDYTIDCIAGTFKVTLPTAVGIQGKIYIIKNSGVGTITIDTTSSQTIDGASSKALSTQYQVIRVQSTGANWIVI